MHVCTQVHVAMKKLTGNLHKKGTSMHNYGDTLLTVTIMV